MSDFNISKNAKNSKNSKKTNNNKKNLFRLQSKKLFLTYSQIQDKFNKEELKEFLCNKLDVNKYVVAEEPHKDGGLHMHVYLELNKICNIINCHFLDFKEIHGNYVKVKNDYKVKKYCTKEDNYITNIIHFGVDFMKDAKNLAQKGKINEALDIIINNLPKEIKFLDKYQANFNLVYKLERLKNNPKKNYRFELDTFQYDEIKEKMNEFMKCKFDKSLYFEGTSGWGKTQFLKTYFSKYDPLKVGHIDKLKTLKHNNKCIIFDDMSFCHWPRESCIHLLNVDDDTDINVKCSMVTIPEGTIKIFCSNFSWKTIFPAHDKAIRRRMFKIKITKPLINLKPKSKGIPLKIKKIKIPKILLPDFNKL